MQFSQGNFFETLLHIFWIFYEYFLKNFWKFFWIFCRNFLQIFLKNWSPPEKILATPMFSWAVSQRCSSKGRQGCLKFENKSVLEKALLIRNLKIAFLTIPKSPSLETWKIKELIDLYGDGVQYQRKFLIEWHCLC